MADRSRFQSQASLTDSDDWLTSVCLHDWELLSVLTCWPAKFVMRCSKCAARETWGNKRFLDWQAVRLAKRIRGE